MIKVVQGEEHLWLDRVEVLPRPKSLETTSNGGQRLLGSLTFISLGDMCK